MRVRQRVEEDVARGRYPERWGGWFVVGLWALALVPFAGTRNLYYEEGRYTLAALDMLQNGHWLRPEVLGVGFVAKPPLLYWLVASAISLGGVSEWVVRTPGEILPPAWLITAAPPPLGAREMARGASRRGVVYRVWRVGAAD